MKTELMYSLPLGHSGNQDYGVPGFRGNKQITRSLCEKGAGESAGSLLNKLGAQNYAAALAFSTTAANSFGW